MPRTAIALLLISLTACSDPTPPAHAASKSEPKPTVQAPKLDANEELAIRVRRALEEAGRIDAPAIDIRAIDGVISLFGTTGTKDELERAGRIASEVDGVRSVENHLVVVRGS